MGLQDSGSQSKAMGSTREAALPAATLQCSGPPASYEAGEGSHWARHPHARLCPADSPVPCPQVLRLYNRGSAQQGHRAAVLSQGEL